MLSWGNAFIRHGQYDTLNGINIEIQMALPDFSPDSG